MEWGANTRACQHRLASGGIRWIESGIEEELKTYDCESMASIARERYRLFFTRRPRSVLHPFFDWLFATSDDRVSQSFAVCGTGIGGGPPAPDSGSSSWLLHMNIVPRRDRCWWQADAPSNGYRQNIAFPESLRAISLRSCSEVEAAKPALLSKFPEPHQQEGDQRKFRVQRFGWQPREIHQRGISVFRLLHRVWLH